MQLNTNEKILTGKWVYEKGTVSKNQACERIEWMLENQLKQLGMDASGWDSLYLNPSDNSFWELIFPQSQIQGGGPPTLIYLSKEEARLKYPEIQLNE